MMIQTRIWISRSGIDKGMEVSALREAEHSSFYTEAEEGLLRTSICIIV